MNLALFFTFLALTCTASIAIPLTELSNKDATIFNHAQVYKFLQDSLKNSKDAIIISPTVQVHQVTTDQLPANFQNTETITKQPTYQQPQNLLTQQPIQTQVYHQQDQSFITPQVQVQYQKAHITDSQIITPQATYQHLQAQYQQPMMTGLNQQNSILPQLTQAHTTQLDPNYYQHVLNQNLGQQYGIPSGQLSLSNSVNSKRQQFNIQHNQNVVPDMGQLNNKLQNGMNQFGMQNGMNQFGMQNGMNQFGMQNGMNQFGMQNGMNQFGMQNGMNQFGMQNGMNQMGMLNGLPQIGLHNKLEGSGYGVKQSMAHSGKQKAMQNALSKLGIKNDKQEVKPDVNVNQNSLQSNMEQYANQKNTPRMNHFSMSNSINRFGAQQDMINFSGQALHGQIRIKNGMNNFGGQQLSMLGGIQNGMNQYGNGMQQYGNPGLGSDSLGVFHNKQGGGDKGGFGMVGHRRRN